MLENVGEVSYLYWDKGGPMKAFVASLVLFLGAAFFASAESVYVVAKVAPLFAKPAATAAKVTTLKQGDTLVIQEKTNGWYRVTVANQEGWVRSMFTADKPVVKAEVTADSFQLDNVVSRKRASAYTTSAAATRGLSSDNVRLRENLAFKDYNFQAASWMATFQYTEEEILAFGVSEGILH